MVIAIRTITSNMKKITQFLFLMAFLSGFIAQAQTHLYENPKFDELAKDHKNIAILPFKTKIELRPKQMEKLESGQLEEMQKSEAESLQEAMHSWFLKRKKRGTLAIDVQQPSRTRTLLLKQNINSENIDAFTPEELAQILEVDAIISGTYETNKPMSEGASIALGLLIGVWGRTNSAVVNMNINNSGDGELLWNYNKKVSGSFGSNSDDLINVLMRKASRRLAYTK